MIHIVVRYFLFWPEESAIRKTDAFEFRLIGQEKNFVLQLTNINVTKKGLVFWTAIKNLYFSLSSWLQYDILCVHEVSTQKLLRNISNGVTCFRKKENFTVRLWNYKMAFLVESFNAFRLDYAHHWFLTIKAIYLSQHPQKQGCTLIILEIVVLIAT